jgi:glycosyltransferase involved in cell wall biosynthesis
MRRFLDRKARADGPEIKEISVRGSIERAHAGLISGWLECELCDAPVDAPVLRMNGGVIEGRRSLTRRPDVPRGQGFVLRFDPAGSAATAPVSVWVQCALHNGAGIERVVETEDWRVPVLGFIENASWPIIAGWLAVLAPSDESVMLEIPGLPPVAARQTVPRPDAQPFLGSEGVAGFRADMSDAQGYAVPNGTVVRLTQGTRALHEAVVSGSPIGDETESCFPNAMSSPGRLDAEQVSELLGRFHSASVRSGGEGWLDLLAGLGIHDDSAQTRQWADYLEAKGLPPDVVAGWLGVRAVQALRVPALDPLPAHLSARLEQALSSALPSRVLAWRDGVTSVNHGAAISPRPNPADIVGDRVCVAGLLNHRSGLGQHAQHSINALEGVGFHACSAPFFPAPGGWNPRLGPSRESASAMRDHAVLLHAPIDGFVQSLTAQPALLASRRIIACFYWETEVVPRQFHRSLDIVDEIWAATEFVAGAFRSVTETPVRIVGNAVDISKVDPISRAELGIAEDAFVTLFCFDASSTVARKNPSAAIDAFRLAFEGDPGAVFILKVRNLPQAEHLARQGDPHALGMMERLRDDPSIRLLSGEWSHARGLGLIQLADCFISLHRSEGYGYSIAEAMALGTPVVATDYSGSSDFLSAREGWPVPYEMIDVLPEEYFFWEPGMAWAEADIHAAAEQLRAVRSGLGVVERTLAARTRIASEASLEALGANYVRALIDPDDGPCT